MVNTKVFITGHKGFLGKNLSDFLSDQKNISLITYSGDLLDEDALNSFFEENKPDIVIHLAGVYSFDFEIVIEKNIKISNTIAHYSEKHGVKKLIFSSSGAVYGTFKGSSFKESDPLFPIDFYGLSKKICEDLLQFYSSRNAFKLIILRFPNIYSSKLEGHGVIAKFLEQIASKNEVIIYGDGNQRRDFLHIRDVCSSILKAIEYNDSGVFNISSVTNYSLNEILNMLKDKYTFDVKYLDRKNSLNNLRLDFSKAVEDLKYENNVKIIKI